MIEEILGRIFPIAHGLDPASIHVPIARYTVPFTETDPKSCNPCQTNPNRANRAGCNREILRVNNNGEEIAVVDFEQFVAQIKSAGMNVGEHCGLILTDSGMDKRKIAFCDLCCYEEKYIEPNSGNEYPQGKRAKARQQMERTIENLIQDSTTAVNLLTYHEKVCMFAWRDYDVPDVPVIATRRDARSNVQVFGSVASNMASTTTSLQQKAGYDFTFIQVKYPTTYNW